MLKSTKDLLNCARIYFDELGYHFHIDDGDLDYDKFHDCFVDTMNHTKTLKDAIEALKMFRYIDKKSEKIAKAIYKYPDFFDSLEYGSNEVLSLVSDDEAVGAYTITNAIGKWNELIVFSINYGSPFAFGYDNKLFSVFEDSNYFLRYSFLSKEKMVILDNNKNKLCVIKLNKDFDIELENNSTNYEVNIMDGVVFFYRKGELQKSKDNFDAYMTWDILEKNSLVGVTRVVIYDENADDELILLMSAASMLLYKGKHDAAVTANSALMLQSMVYKRK